MYKFCFNCMFRIINLINPIKKIIKACNCTLEPHATVVGRLVDQTYTVKNISEHEKFKKKKKILRKKFVPFKNSPEKNFFVILNFKL